MRCSLLRMGQLLWLGAIVGSIGRCDLDDIISRARAQGKLIVIEFRSDVPEDRGLRTIASAQQWLTERAIYETGGESLRKRLRFWWPAGVVVLRSDGTEVDRYSPTQYESFVAIVGASLDGRNTIALRRAALERAATSEVEVHAPMVLTLIVHSRFEQALDELEWCYRMKSADAAQSAIRLVALSQHGRMLVQHFPPAAVRFREWRGELEKRVRDDRDGADAARALIAVNEALQEEARSQQLYDELAGQDWKSPETRSVLVSRLLTPLCKAKRYGDIVDGLTDPLRLVRVVAGSAGEEWAESRDWKSVEETLDPALATFEALAACHRDESARLAAETIGDAMGDKRVWIRLIHAAGRGKNGNVGRQVARYAVDRVVADARQDIEQAAAQLPQEN